MTTLDSGRPGPHAAINALMHGNEISGAIALDHFMRQDLAPLRGKLSCIFANTAAFETFNPATPNASRFIDEDMNRLWADGATDGGTNLERSRVRVLRPFFETVDMLLDLHSMQSESPPLLLSGPREKGRMFARSLNSPAVIVCIRATQTACVCAISPGSTRLETPMFPFSQNAASIGAGAPKASQSTRSIAFCSQPA
ncbi:MAG: succinylglutamate desuccinylase/aspartoacylase family protein [Rhodospirillaceae bacterium]